MSGHPPLTPPEYYEAYGSGTVQSKYHPDPTESQLCPLPCHEGYVMNAYSLSKEPACTLLPLTRIAAGKGNGYWSTSGVTAPVNTVLCAVDSSSLPILPPITNHDQSAMETHHVQTGRGLPAPPVAPIKEEKATGGVSAHLDYEMESMAAFVAEMVQGMYDLYDSRICLADIDILRSVYPKPAAAPGAPAFRTYVLQVLSSTRLPSSTILLGLHYLVTRMKLLSSSGKYSKGGGQIHRMLIMALLLGSKFLDDNTFQNRSWSEVSNIHVAELNVLELDWLDAVKWNLHINPDDTQGFKMWRLHWQRWQTKRFEKSLEALKLTPLEVNVQRFQRASRTGHSASTTHSPPSNNSAYSSSGTESSPWYTTPYNRWPSIQSRTEYSPPSAPETSPTWYRGQPERGYDFQSRCSPTTVVRSNSRLSFPGVQQSAYSTPYYQSYVGNSWNWHFPTCSCSYCTPATDRYFSGLGFRIQSVSG